MWISCQHWSQGASKLLLNKRNIKWCKCNHNFPTTSCLPIWPLSPHLLAFLNLLLTATGPERGMTAQCHHEPSPRSVLTDGQTERPWAPPTHLHRCRRLILVTVNHHQRCQSALDTAVQGEKKTGVSLATWRGSCGSGQVEEESGRGHSSSGEAVSEARGSTGSARTFLSGPLSPAVRHRTARQG